MEEMILFEDEKQRITLGYPINHKNEEVEPQLGTKINLNPDDLCMDVLLQAVKEQLPVVDHQGVKTTKTIVYVSRVDCCCCHTAIGALVFISSFGTVCDDAEAIRGLYDLRMGINTEKMAAQCKKEYGRFIPGKATDYWELTVSKFSAEVIMEKEIEPLERPNWLENKKLKQKVDTGELRILKKTEGIYLI